jgi:uncharacterized membrane protein
MAAPSSRVQVLSRTFALLSGFTLVPLLAWDVAPKRFPNASHATLAATPLALVAIACLIHPFARRARFPDIVKASLLAAAFLFWAANQFWPDYPLSTVFNDIAVALFVLDVFLAVFRWPSNTPEDAILEPLNELGGE